MTSTGPLSFQSVWLRVAFLCVVLLASATVHANPVNCDDDMTDDQRFQAELCSAHIGCRFVFAIAETCTKVKSFLSKLGLGGRGSAATVTDDRVSYALVESGVPRSGISSCLFDFDRAKCKEYFSGGPKQPSAKDQADDIVEQLKSKVYDTTVWDAGLGLAKEGLRMCGDATNEANMRDAVRAKERCALAGRNIRTCFITKDGHEALRKKLQGLIDNGGLGADAAGYRNLANTRYPECPTTLPGSGKTPEVALADYLKFWDTPEEPKSKQADTTDGEATTALPRRGANSGSTLFQNAITQAEQEERDRPAREARERAAQARAAEQERLARAKAAADARRAQQEQARKDEQNARGTGEALGQLLGVIGQIQQGKADRQQAQHEEQQRLLQEKQQQQRRVEEARQPSSTGVSSGRNCPNGAAFVSGQCACPNGGNLVNGQCRRGVAQ